MSATPEYDQAADGILNINHHVSGAPLGAVSAAKYQMFDEDGAVVMTKTLNNGISVVNGVIRVVWNEEDSMDLTGTYLHECVVRDPQGTDLYPLKKGQKIKFNPTRVRL